MDGLRQLLESLYDDPQNAKIALASIGLDLGGLNFNTTPAVLWGNVLLTAQKHEKVEAVVDVAANDFPARRTELFDALGRFLRMPLILLLAELYSAEADARAVLKRAGVAANQVDQGANTVAFWEAALASAAKAGKVPQIVKLASDSFRLRRSELTRAEKDYIRGCSKIEVQPPPPPVQVRVVNVPPFIAPSYFQDRHVETKIVSGFLKDDSKRLFIVVGRGGIGKTSMICRVLKTLEGGSLPEDGGPLHVDGIVYMSTIGTKRVSAENLFKNLCQFLPEDKARDLGIVFASVLIRPAVKMQTLLAEFPGGRYMVFLDNLESLINIETFAITDVELDEALRTLLEAEHHAVKVLITSRVPPGPLMQVQAARQTVCYLDAGLESPYAENILRELDADNALHLRDASDELLGRARQLTRGYPKALEALFAILAADRGTSLEEVLEVTATAQVDQIVMVLVGEAFSRLDPTAQRVMQALAIFNRPVTAGAVNYLLHAHLPGLDCTDVIHRLVSLQFARKEGKSYYLHPTDRAYALSLVPKGQDWDRQETGVAKFTRIALLHRAGDYFRNDRKPPEAIRQGDDLAAQRAEIELRCEGEEYEAAADVLVEIDVDYLCLWGMNNEVVRLYTLLLGQTADRALTSPCHIKDPKLLARCLIGLGTARYYLGEYIASIDSFTRAMEMARESRDLEAEGRCLGYLGHCLYYLGHVEKALECETNVLSIADRIGDESPEKFRLSLMGHGRLGICLDLGGETPQAITHITDALAAARTIEDQREEGFYLDLLGLLEGYLEDYDVAFQHLNQALEIARSIDDWYGVSMHLCNLMETWNNLREFQQAIDTSQELKTRYRSLNPAVGSWGNVELAVALLGVGDLDAARAAAAEARRNNVPQNSYMASATVGLVAYRQGQLDNARQAFLEAEKLADDLLRSYAKNFSALDAKGLCAAGLSRCAGEPNAPLAVEAYERARSITRIPGHVRRSVLLLDLLLGPGDSFAEVRTAAAGSK